MVTMVVMLPVGSLLIIVVIIPLSVVAILPITVVLAIPVSLPVVLSKHGSNRSCTQEK